MANYEPVERETIVEFNNAENEATVCTFQKPMQRRLEAWIKERPDEVIVTHVYDDGDGLEVRVPKTWIKIHPPRLVGAAQRLAVSERMKSRHVNSKTKKANATLESGSTIASKA